MNDAGVFFRCLLFFCIGCVLWVGDLVWVAWIALFVYRATPATGVITAQSRGGGFHPEVQFTTLEGEQAQVSLSSGFTWVEVGQQVPLLYLPPDPHSAYIDAFGSLWGFPLMVFAMGAAFVTVALGTLWTERR